MRALFFLSLLFAAGCNGGGVAPPADPETTTVQIFAEHPDGGFVGAVVDDGQVIDSDDAILGTVATKTRFRAFHLSAYPDSTRAQDVQASNSRHGTRIEAREYCWYLVTYKISTGEIVSEKLVFCDNWGTNPCDETQQAIAEEYVDYNVARSHPNCEHIEYEGARAVHFSWSELNGHWQEGNPHEHYGWVSQALKDGLDDMRTRWGDELKLSSGYRCPHGNASIPGASPTSWHIEGRAADISVKWLAGVGSDWPDMSTAERVRVEKIWYQLHDIAQDTDATDLQPFGAYDDRHYHAAW